MKRIKFEVWCKDRKRFLENEYLILMNGEVYESFRDLEDGIPLANYKVVFYTGLKDKNGVEIYENDIDTDEYGNLSIVKYIERYAAYCFVPIELYLHEDYENDVMYQFGYDCFFQNIIPNEYAEIIGNLYENPELLQGSDNQ